MEYNQDSISLRGVSDTLQLPSMSPHLDVQRSHHLSETRPQGKWKEHLDFKSV